MYSTHISWGKLYLGLLKVTSFIVHIHVCAYTSTSTSTSTLMREKGARGVKGVVFFFLFFFFKKKNS